VGAKVSLEQGLIRTVRYFEQLLRQGTAAVHTERARLSGGMAR
jgi:hypothetical protein